MAQAPLPSPFGPSALNTGGQSIPVQGHTFHPQQQQIPGGLVHMQQAQGIQQGQAQGNNLPQQRNVPQTSHPNQRGQEGQGPSFQMQNGQVVARPGQMQKLQGSAMPIMMGAMPGGQQFQMMAGNPQNPQQHASHVQMQHPQQQMSGQTLSGQPVMSEGSFPPDMMQRHDQARMVQGQGGAQPGTRIINGTAMQGVEGPNGPVGGIVMGQAQRQHQQQAQQVQSGQMTRQSVPPPTPQAQTPQTSHLPQPGHLQVQGPQIPQSGQGSVTMTPSQMAQLQGMQHGQQEGNWDGEVMLHLYIHDYLMKRQFHKAAAALRAEAALGEQLVVPIDCQQGLLYEWWAVFWDVFSTGNGRPQPSPEAIQFMNAQLRQRLSSHQQLNLGRQSQPMTPQMAQLFRQQQQQAMRAGQQVVGIPQANGVVGQQAFEMTAAARQQMIQQQQQRQQQQNQQAVQQMVPGANANSGIQRPPSAASVAQGTGNQLQMIQQQQQQQRMLQAQNQMSPNVGRPVGMPVSQQSGADAGQAQFLPPGATPAQMQNMRSVTPQIQVQAANDSAQMGGYQLHMQQQQQQRAHLAAQQQAAQQQQQQIQHLQGQQQRQQHAGQQAAAMQANLMQQQKAAADLQAVVSALGITNCQAQVLSGALWATGLANRHPDGWSDAEKSRVLGSYNVMLENSRKDESQHRAQRTFGDPNALGFQRPQSIVPASPSNNGAQQNMAFRMNGMPHLTPQQQQMYLQQISHSTRPADEESGNSPPNKRLRRNSGSAAASPFSHTAETPQTHATPHPQQTPVSATLSLNHQIALQAQAQQLSATQAQAQAQAAYMQNIHQQQQTQHLQQQQQHMQRQQMMQQLQGGGPSPADVRVYQQRIAEQQRQSMRAVTANSQGSHQQYNPQASPLPLATEGDGEGGAATPAFEAQINSTPGAAQLSFNPLQRSHSSRSTTRIPPNAQHSPSMAGLATPNDAPEHPPGNGGDVQASPGVLQSMGSANGENEKTPSPVGGKLNAPSTGELNGHSPAEPVNAAATQLRQQTVLPAPPTPKPTGQPLPSPSQQAQVGMPGMVDQPQNMDAAIQPPAPVTDPADSISNQNRPMNQEEGDGGVDFSHLLGNDLFNSMNGGEDGAEYDINFANFGMDGDIFEIYMNDGYEGGPQTGEGN